MNSYYENCGLIGGGSVIFALLYELLQMDTKLRARASRMIMRIRLHPGIRRTLDAQRAETETDRNTRTH